MNNADKTIIILGGGGHAAVGIEIARICGFEPVAEQWLAKACRPGPE